MSTNIPYLDEGWNPIVGCTPVSEGCKHCWARAMQSRFSGGPEEHPVFHEERVEQPMHWRKPRRIGVCFMSDLWHSDVRPEWRQRIYQVCRNTIGRGHTYLFLTKRADSMCRWVSDTWDEHDHLWHGVTIESQQRADDRVGYLLTAKVAHRWLSIEPLLGPISLKKLVPTNSIGEPYGLECVVIGCESGPGARPCPLEWVEQVVEECMACQIPVYVKQIRIGKDLVTNPAFFPKYLQLRQLPEGWK